MPLEFKDRTDAEFANRTGEEWNKQITLTVQGSGSASSSGNTVLSQQKHLVCQAPNSLSQVGPIVLSAQKSIVLAQSKSTSSSGALSLLQGQRITLADNRSLTNIGSVVARQGHALSVQGSKSLTSHGSSSITQKQILTVQEAASLENIGACVLSNGYNLVVQGTSSISSTSSISLAPALLLSTISSLTSSAQVVLRQSNILSVNSEKSDTFLGTRNIVKSTSLIVSNISSNSNVGQINISRQANLVVQNSASLSNATQLAISLQPLLHFVDTQYTTFQDRTDTKWATIEYRLNPQGSGSNTFAGVVLLSAYLTIPETRSQTNMEGVDWRYLLAGDGAYILTGDGGKIVINQGLTQGHHLTIQDIKSTTISTSILSDIRINGSASITKTDVLSLKSAQHILLNDNKSLSSIGAANINSIASLTVEDCKSVTNINGVSLSVVHWAAIPNNISLSVLDALSLKQSHGLTISDERSLSLANSLIVAQIHTMFLQDLVSDCSIQNIIITPGLETSDLLSVSSLPNLEVAQIHKLLLQEETSISLADTFEFIIHGIPLVHSLASTTTIDPLLLTQQANLTIQDVSSISTSGGATTERIFIADSVSKSSIDALFFNTDLALGDLNSVTETNDIATECRHHLVLSEPSSVSGINALNLAVVGYLTIQDAVSPSLTGSIKPEGVADLLVDNSKSLSGIDDIVLNSFNLNTLELLSLSSTDGVIFTQSHILSIQDSKSLTPVENIPLGFTLWGDLNVILVGMGSEIQFHGHGSKIDFGGTSSQVLFKAKRGIYK